MLEEASTSSTIVNSALLAELVRQQTLLGVFTRIKEKLMAGQKELTQALDDIQNTVDLTQENVASLLAMLKADPNSVDVGAAIARLEAINKDLGGTSFDSEAGNTTGPSGGTA